MRQAAVGKLRTVLFVLLSIGYPLFVYAMLDRFEPRWLAALLFLLALLRALGRRGQGNGWLVLATGVLTLWAFAGNSALPLKLYPVLVNVILLLVFGLSLRFGVPVVERLARLREPDLAPAGVRYTRQVTWAWCGFFMFNGGMALATALCGSDRIWALYNGLIAYVLIGLFFGLEWCVRQRVRSRA